MVQVDRNPIEAGVPAAAQRGNRVSMVALQLPPAVSPAFVRFAALAPLDAAALAALERAIAASVTDRPRSELLREGREIPGALLIVDGWAARMRILPDGRRQFLSFLLPGDVIGMCQHERPLAVSTVVAVTPLTTCRAPDRADYPALGQAYAVSGALEEAYLLAQITRLGRLSALERL